MSLAFLLDSEYATIWDKIVGKRILLASYGSGNTMAVISAKVAERAPAVLGRWKTGEIWSAARRSSWEEYSRWLDRRSVEPAAAAALEASDPPRGAFYLAGVRKDGYREYGFR
jgi:hydroxymethylglutaryl-CoA synthase